MKLYTSIFLVLFSGNIFAEINVKKIGEDTFGQDPTHFYITPDTKHLLSNANTITYYYTNKVDPKVNSLIKSYADLIGNFHGVLITSGEKNDLLLEITSTSNCKVPSEKLWPSLVLENKKRGVCYQFDLADKNILMILTVLKKELKKGFSDELDKLVLGVRTKNVIDGYIAQYKIIEPLRSELHKLVDYLINEYSYKI